MGEGEAVILRALRWLWDLPRRLAAWAWRFAGWAWRLPVRLVREAWRLPFRLMRGVRAAARSRAAAPLAVAVLVPLLVSPVGAERGGLDPAGDGVEVATAPRSDDQPGGGPGAVSPAEPVFADEVPVVRPDLLVRSATPIEASSLSSVLGVEGVEHLAGTAEQNVLVDAPQGPVGLRVLVVDPTAFRPLTPDATARTKALWERLADGEAVLRHDVAQHHGLELGSTVPITGPSGQPVDVRIGGLASNGTPPLADAILPWSVGDELGVEHPNLIVIAVSDAVSNQEVGERLRAAVGEIEITELEEPMAQQASLVGAGAHRFESFSYIDHGDGMITIDPGWVRRNIVRAQVPILGTVRCHHAMIPQLRAALQEVADRGLAGMIDTSDYGGCWVPRHILFDPDRPISMHAWGLAIDFNVRTNGYGAHPQLDQRIVEVFRRWGFTWGGDWSIPDGMHFELRALIQ